MTNSKFKKNAKKVSATSSSTLSSGGSCSMATDSLGANVSKSSGGRWPNGGMMKNGGWSCREIENGSKKGANSPEAMSSESFIHDANTTQHFPNHFEKNELRNR